MDPPSISVRVNEIAQVAGAAAREFKKLRIICKTLPGRLHALSNEVADLELIIDQVARLTAQRQSDLSFDATALTRLLSQASEKLHEVHLITNGLISVCEEHPYVFSAPTWKKNPPHLQRLQEELQTIKTNINLLLGSSHSSVPAIPYITIENLHQQVDQRIAAVEETLCSNANKFAEQQAQQLGTVYGPLAPSTITLGSRVRRRSSILQQDGRRSSLEEKLQDVCFRARTVHPCSKACTCRCHSSSKAMLPGFASRLFGQIFCQYSGLPMLRNNCNLDSCKSSQSSQLSVEYWFPASSFWSQIVRFRVAYNAMTGPQFELITLRLVPDSSKSVHFAMKGDIQGLKDLFKRGLASPRDVSVTRGYSLMRWAVYAQQFQTAKFLLQAGADPDYRPIAIFDNTPRHKANQYLLMGGLSDENKDALTALTQEGDFIDEQNYTLIHRIILGLSLKDLDQELHDNPDLIDVVDAMGRTPLIWAACRGDERAIVKLLQHDAEVDIVDIQYTNAVSYAAERNFTICVRILLEAGADPNIAQAHGYPVGDAINVAARNASDPLIIKTLLDFGADPDWCGPENNTALIHASRRDNVSFALLLIEHGADLDAKSSADLTPLTAAVAYNSHNVLKLLLDRWFEYSECPRLRGQHLLEHASKYADEETIAILTGTEHFLIKHDENYLSVNYEKYLLERLDASEKISKAFEELVRVIGVDHSQLLHASRHLRSKDSSNDLEEADMDYFPSPETKKILESLLARAIVAKDDE